MRHVDSISLFPSKAKGKNKEITATTTPSVFKLAYFELKKKKESQLPENTYLKKSLFLDRKKKLVKQACNNSFPTTHSVMYH